MMRVRCAALTAMLLALAASPAAAQIKGSGEIGSYQAILSQAGFSNQESDFLAAPAQGQVQSALPAAEASATNSFEQAPSNSNDVYQSTVGDCGSDCDCGCGPLFGRCGSGRCGSRFRLLGPNVNRVVSVYGVSLGRTYEGNQRIAYNGSGTEYLTNDINNGDLEGLGVTLATRGCCGGGWEVTYWEMDECAEQWLPGPTFTRLYGLGAINHVPSGNTMADIFNSGSDVAFCRNTDVENVEINFLRNGGQYTSWGCWKGSYEVLAGLRVFTFDEDFAYISNSTAAGVPAQVGYNFNTENTLVGFQVGGRNEICLTSRLRLSTGSTVGVFNNHIESRQQLYDSTGYNPVIGSGPYAGTPFDFSAENDDMAFMGQLDVGLIYQLTCRFRARFGYRAIGATGIAMALDQLPYEYTDGYMLQSVNAGSGLKLDGWYYGGEFCF